MLRYVTAVFAALVIVLTGIAQPAYAYSQNSGIVFDNHQEHNSDDYYYSSRDYYGSSQNAYSDRTLTDSFVDGAVEGVGGLVGAVTACYALDAVATTVFPPAAALAAFCPALGGAAAITGIQASR